MSAKHGRYVPPVFVQRTCKCCGKEFSVDQRDIRKNRPGNFCSRSCVGRHTARQRVGALNPNWKGGVTKDNMRYRRRFTSKFPEKVKVHKMIQLAVKRGELQRLPCVHCGADVKTEAHHTDYSKPFEITWLCKTCHRKEHGRMRREVVTLPRRPSVEKDRRKKVLTPRRPTLLITEQLNLFEVAK